MGSMQKKHFLPGMKHRSGTWLVSTRLAATVCDRLRRAAGNDSIEVRWTRYRQKTPRDEAGCISSMTLPTTHTEVVKADW